MNGASDEVISAQLTDKELLNQFKAVEKLSQEDKHLIKTFVDVFLTKNRFKNSRIKKARGLPGFNLN